MENDATPIAVRIEKQLDLLENRNLSSAEIQKIQSKIAYLRTLEA